MNSFEEVKCDFINSGLYANAECGVCLQDDGLYFSSCPNRKRDLRQTVSKFALDFHCCILGYNGTQMTRSLSYNGTL